MAETPPPQEQPEPQRNGDFDQEDFAANTPSDGRFGQAAEPGANEQSAVYDRPIVGNSPNHFE